MAQEVVKDPYWFDFVSVSQKARERDIEKQLVTHITQFLLELGKGFAFVGEQYCLNLNNKEYFCDLLFYHIPLRAYVVIELLCCAQHNSSLGNNDWGRFLATNLVPILLNFSLVQREKAKFSGGGDHYKFVISETGNKFLSLYHLNNL